MNRAITVKYLKPTAKQGARLKATSYTCSLTQPYPHDQHAPDAYRALAVTLAHSRGWRYSTIHGAATAHGEMVFIAVGVEP